MQTKMETKNIIENNKLIAIFMGYLLTSDEFKMKWLGVKDISKLNSIK